MFDSVFEQWEKTGNDQFPPELFKCRYRSFLFRGKNKGQDPRFGLLTF